MNVLGTGSVTATTDSALIVGNAVNDSFLVNGQSNIFGGAPTPAMSLDGNAAISSFYRDSDGDSGLQSLLGFGFDTAALDGLLDQSDLNGDYNLPTSVFSAFVAGTHTGLTAGINPGFLAADIGEVTIVVAESSGTPLPSGLALLILGLLGVSRGRQSTLRLLT